jgi:hypothetical protein
MVIIPNCSKSVKWMAPRHQSPKKPVLPYSTQKQKKTSSTMINCFFLTSITTQRHTSPTRLCNDGRSIQFSRREQPPENGMEKRSNPKPAFSYKILFMEFFWFVVRPDVNNKRSWSMLGRYHRYRCQSYYCWFHKKCTGLMQTCIAAWSSVVTSSCKRREGLLWNHGLVCHQTPTVLGVQILIIR